MLDWKSMFYEMSTKRYFTYTMKVPTTTIISKREYHVFGVSLYGFAKFFKTGNKDWIKRDIDTDVQHRNYTTTTTIKIKGTYIYVLDSKSRKRIVNTAIAQYILFMHRLKSKKSALVFIPANILAAVGRWNIRKMPKNVLCATDTFLYKVLKDIYTITKRHKCRRITEYPHLSRSFMDVIGNTLKCTFHEDILRALSCRDIMCTHTCVQILRKKCFTKRRSKKNLSVLLLILKQMNKFNAPHIRKLAYSMYLFGMNSKADITHAKYGSKAHFRKVYLRFFWHENDTSVTIRHPLILPVKKRCVSIEQMRMIFKREWKGFHAIKDVRVGVLTPLTPSTPSIPPLPAPQVNPTHQRNHIQSSMLKKRKRGIYDDDEIKLQMPQQKKHKK